MSLQGTFDVFSISELLRMLAASNKSGTLTVESSGVAGHLDLFEGKLWAAESVERRGRPIASAVSSAVSSVGAGAVSSASDVLHRCAVDMCFEIERATGGEFCFMANEAANESISSSTTNSADDAAFAPIEPILVELELLLGEWAEICTIIASTAVRPVLVAEIADDEIVIRAREWRLLARADGVRSIDDLWSDDRSSSIVDVCRAVADLVRRGAVELVEPPMFGAGLGFGSIALDDPRFADDAEDRDSVDPRFADGAEPRAVSKGDADAEVESVAHQSAVLPVAPYGPGVDQANLIESRRADGRIPVEPAAPSATATADAVLGVDGGSDIGEVAATPEDVREADGRDRGAILRMFSGLREA